jgi:hypothetical protein
MTELNSNQSARELTKKEWRTPLLRKLPIAATANSQGKSPAFHNDGNQSKNGDVQNLS